MTSTTPLPLCTWCRIGPDYPNLVLSNGTVNITSPDLTNTNLDLSYPGFSTAGVEFTGYRLSSQFGAPLTVYGYFCSSTSTEISLATPFFVPMPATSVPFFYETALTPFAYALNPGCDAFDYMSEVSARTVGPASTVTFSRSGSSNKLTAVATTATSYSSSHSPQSPSTGLTRRRKLIIGLVMALVFPTILVIIGLSSFCILKGRQQKGKESGASSQHCRVDKNDGIQIYLQRKVELDAEQRRHEIGGAEIRSEMDGEDKIHELPGEEGQKRTGT